MSADLAERIRRAVPDGGPPDHERIRDRAEALRRRRRAGRGALGLLLLVVVAVPVVSRVVAAPEVVLDGRGGPIEGPRVADSVLDLPARGETEPAWLDDGTPVSVVHDEDGDVHVVEAVSTHRTGPDKLVGWCRSGTFYDPFHASEWGPEGQYVSGPAPTGLPTYVADVDGATVRVGARRAPTAREAGPGITRTGPSCEGAGQELEVPGFHNPAAAPWPTVGPENVPQHDGPMIVHGTLVLDGEGSAWVCGDASSTWPRCPAGTTRLASAHEPQGASVHTGTLLVTVDGERYAFARFRDVETMHFDGPTGQPYAPPVRVRDDGVVTVPATDLTYGRPLGEPIQPGTYELHLDNRGGIQHTLVNQQLGVHLSAEPGEEAAATVELPPGEHTFFCRIPGHREAGMELVLTVR